MIPPAALNRSPASQVLLVHRHVRRLVVEVDLAQPAHGSRRQEHLLGEHLVADQGPGLRARRVVVQVLQEPLHRPHGDHEAVVAVAELDAATVGVAGEGQEAVEQGGSCTGRCRSGCPARRPPWRRP